MEPSRSITVRANLNDGSFTDQIFSIAINDVDEFDVGTVTDTNATSNNVNENAAVGTLVVSPPLASDATQPTIPSPIRCKITMVDDSPSIVPPAS
jgi:protocadherin Fat 4